MPLHFQMIDQRPTGLENFVILLGRNASEIARADFARTLADRLRLTLQPVPFHERLVHGDVPALCVFDKERHVWRLVEQPFQQADIDGGNRRRGHRVRRFCARIHGSMRFWNKRVMFAEVRIESVESVGLNADANMRNGMNRISWPDSAITCSGAGQQAMETTS